MRLFGVSGPATSDEGCGRPGGEGEPTSRPRGCPPSAVGRGPPSGAGGAEGRASASTRRIARPIALSSRATGEGERGGARDELAVPTTSALTSLFAFRGRGALKVPGRVHVPQGRIKVWGTYVLLLTSWLSLPPPWMDSIRYYLFTVYFLPWKPKISFRNPSLSRLRPGPPLLLPGNRSKIPRHSRLDPPSLFQFLGRPGIVVVLTCKWLVNEIFLVTLSTTPYKSPYLSC